LGQRGGGGRLGWLEGREKKRPFSFSSIRLWEFMNKIQMIAERDSMELDTDSQRD
jgi:hypothetical protein